MESLFAQQIAKGQVYHDANFNQKFDSNEKGLNGIRVSNGREVTVTSSDGSYELPVSDDTILLSRRLDDAVERLQFAEVLLQSQTKGLA